jgi:ribose transport system substrate-binding protein
MKRIGALILLFFLLILVLNCQRNKQLDPDKPTIAFIMKTLNNPFFIDMQQGARKAADSLEVNLIIQAAEREVDVERQLQIVENMIQRRVSAICISPSGSREIVPGIVKANQADIPVFVVDTRVDSETMEEAGGHITTFIGSDNEDGGRLAAEYIIEKLNGKGKVAVLEGIPGHETGDARLRGFMETVAGEPDIEIVTSQTANWERSQGFIVFQNILQSYPEVDALFACNDMMALGAVEAIKAAGKTGEIIVVGFDAVEDSREAIEEGVMDATIAQHPYMMGHIAVEKVVEKLSNKTIPEEIPVKIELIMRENL